MYYISTRGDASQITSKTAILRGIAPDGGLYVPLQFPQQDMADLDGKNYADKIGRAHV